MNDAPSILLPPAYLAPIYYYACLLHFHVEIEQFANYSRRTYFNRCRIATANGAIDLSIPVEKMADKTLVRDVRISDDNNWQTTHWRAIESAYSSSPFFEFYQDDLRPFYTKKYLFLFDFDRELQQTILNLIGLPYDITYSVDYKKKVESGIIDSREMIHPKENNVTLQKYFNLIQYYQVFEQKHGFLPGLSIIDLLFNMGNETRLILGNSLKTI